MEAVFTAVRCELPCMIALHTVLESFHTSSSKFDVADATVSMMLLLNCLNVSDRFTNTVHSLLDI